jgi:predicted acylesterase/phospholipase RssA
VAPGDDFRSRLRSRPTAPPWAASDDLWRYREAAAVLAEFDHDTLRPHGAVAPESQARTELLADCDVTPGAGGRPVMSLRRSIRQAALRRLLATNQVQAALDANPDRPPTVLQQVFERCLVSGWPTDAGHGGFEESRALLSVLDWLEGLPGIAGGAPTMDAVSRRITREQLLQPFRDLVGTSFAGRRDQLAALADYVGVHDARRVSERVARTVEHVFSIDERPPLFVHGPGGCGKSTLIARFILEHAEIQERARFPFAYLDFDRPGLVAEEPVTLLAEVIRQLVIQFPDAEPAYRRLAEAWSSEAQSLAADKRPPAAERPTDVSRPVIFHDSDAFLNAFAEFVASLKNDDQPLLLVLDTFEEVQFRSQAYADEVLQFLNRIQARVPRLRTVLCGRVEIHSSRYKLREVPIGNFDRDAAIGFLGARGIESAAVATAIFEQVGGSPLVLRLAADVARLEHIGEQGIDGLPTGWLSLFQSESIEAVLYKRILSHVYDPRVMSLAYPGLVLRVITPDVVLHVLAPACQVPVTGIDDARRVVAIMREQLATILVPAGGDASMLIHRPDMRAILLSELAVKSRKDEEVAARLTAIHTLAVSHYAAFDDPFHRAEELYHRLAVAVDRPLLARRWKEGLAPFLGSSIRELPPGAQLYLAARLDIELPDGMWDSAEDDDWTLFAARRAAQHLEVQNPQAARALLDQRPHLRRRPELASMSARVASATASPLAREYLAGRILPFVEVNAIWTRLKAAGELSMARQVLERLRRREGLADGIPPDVAGRHRLAQQEALLTSKDTELSATARHDRALWILTDEFGDLDDPAIDQFPETLGIAGGILKRRFEALGQVEDLRRAARLYERAALGPLGQDGYAQINAAFMDDLLASVGDHPEVRTRRAQAIRERLVNELPRPEALPPSDSWFNNATRAEALFGLRRYDEATRVLGESRATADPWERQTMARQIATLAHLQTERPLDVPEIRAFFEELLPGAADAARSVVIGKVGLALSGSGFRACFYHLGMLARLAELNVLRHVEVLSCVSGGSIVGACYWLMLKNRLRQKSPMRHEDYVALVQALIEHVLSGVAANIREAAQRGRFQVWGLLRRDPKGTLDAELVAKALDQRFFAPLRDDQAADSMHHLPFTPADHGGMVAGEEFHPGRHNWLRAHKVPVLVLNATTVNTGHAWHFTPTWMGESPWATYDWPDSIPRLEWHGYDESHGWSMTLGRAVAASACVPGVFSPIELNGAYDGFDVQLFDGGVRDSQGTVPLLALDCNVVLVSDAGGQLLLEKHATPGIGGLLDDASRSVSVLMERVRVANHADLSARQRAGLLRGLMFLHLKAGLDAGTIPLIFSQESSAEARQVLSPSGVRRDFQQALAELRTDLDALTAAESDALMACGYQMTKWAFERDLADHTALFDEPMTASWRFGPMLADITSSVGTTERRKALLDALREGSAVRL